MPKPSREGSQVCQSETGLVEGARSRLISKTGRYLIVCSSSPTPGPATFT